MKTKLMFIYTESSLHAGTGSSVSVVDLPIQRERATQYPIVQGSGMKGALRSQVKDKTDPNVISVFGSDPEEVRQQNGTDQAGALSVGEAQLLLFPVRSLSGVFAYVTSAFAIARLRRDLGYAGIPPTWGNIPAPDANKALVTPSNNLVIDHSVVLEEFAFSTQPSPELAKLAEWLADHAFPAGSEYQFWKNKVKQSLVVLPENDFRDFVVNSTEIVTRIKIVTATKTVDKEKGALWTQEMLPSDVLMYSAMVIRDERKNGEKKSADAIAKWLSEGVPTRIQLGGDETTGAGLVALRWTK